MPRSSVIVFLFILVLCAPVSAGVKIYLLSSVERPSGFLTVGDIADVEGRGRTVELIKSIKINPAYYNDGLIDRQELKEVLASAGGGPYLIFGTSVAVPDASLNAAAGQLVKSGDTVSVTAQSGNISAETKGRALDGGRAGDHIRVLIGRRELSGKIISGREVVLR